MGAADGGKEGLAVKADLAVGGLPVRGIKNCGINSTDSSVDIFVRIYKSNLEWSRVA